MRQARAAHPADVSDADPARQAREVKGFDTRWFAALLDAAHAQLGGAIVLVWDNDRRHLSAAMRALIDARPWLTVFQLPAYAPELNPAEGVWSALKRALADLAPRDIDELAGVVATKLKRMQYRSGLLDGFIAQTGFILQPLQLQPFNPQWHYSCPPGNLPGVFARSARRWDCRYSYSSVRPN
ncbi:transposase [Streptosporangium sp. NPDC003464]